MRLPTFASLTEGLRSTVLRFPIPTVFAAIVTGLLVLAVSENFEDESVVFRYAFLAGLGFVASLLGDLVAEARGGSGRNRLLGYAGVVVLLILYGSFIMPDLLDEAHPPFWYSYFILLFALHLGIALVPALAKSGSERLWRFNLNCFLRYFFSSINAAILFGGLALALVSIDKLFELGLSEELYPQLWVICAFFAHPMLFLSGLPWLDALDEGGKFPKPLRFSLQFIGLPLVALYLVILYAYIAKIGIQWSWPNGWVAMPIFILAVISLLTFVLSLPLQKSENWARFYHRWLFRLLLPLSIVLFMALQVRLGDYGMSINRYLGLALALWLFGLSLAYILRPTLKIGWMPFSLLLVSLFSIYGGPVGAFGWSQRAQLNRIHDMANELGVLSNNSFVPSFEQHEPEIVEEFESALRYLLENFGPASLEAELTAFYESHEDWEFSSRRGHYMTNRIMEYLELDDDLLNATTHFYANQSVMPTHGHAWKLDYYFYSYRNNHVSRSYTIENNQLDFYADRTGNTLIIEVNEDEIMQIDITPWVADVDASVKKHGNQNSEPLIWHAKANNWHFTFVCTNAQLNNTSDTFQSATLTVFLTTP